MKSFLLPIFFAFNLLLHSQSFTCLRCSGDGKIEKKCIDCPNYITPKTCYTCDGKGFVSNEKDRYFYSDNIDDIIPQLTVAISKDLSNTLSQYSPESLQGRRIQIIKNNYKNTLVSGMKNEIATKPKEYFESWKDIELQVGNFWATQVFNGNYHEQLNRGLNYLVINPGITDAFAHGKIIPKKNVLINIQFTSSKLFVLEPEYYLTKEAINGSKTFADGRIIKFDGEIIVRNSNNKIIFKKEKKLNIRQNPYHNIRKGRLNKDRENFIIDTEIEPWTTRKDIGKEFIIELNFFDIKLKTTVLVERQNKILKEIASKAFPKKISSTYEIFMINFFSSGWRNFYIDRDGHYAKRKVFKLEW